CARRSFMDYW
nr:immunoglobulin heavy chain junction region [Mus musculus]NSM07061.1 immunoglobulin heavy chain junction region [Mus musculus]NSM08643.1 immunoglobulin heavy chain junction region [Mus musculus]